MRNVWRTALAVTTLSVTALAAGGLATSAHAQSHPVTNQNPGVAIIVNSNDDVIATYLGTSAAFTDLLYLQNTGQFLFNNQTSAVGSTVNLGRFNLGTELIFRLFVTNTSTDFFSGDPTRNSDGLGHAAVQSDYLIPGTTLVSFEDLPESQEFNDLSFSFTGTTAAVPSVPEPGTWAMMVIGFGSIGYTARVRRRARIAIA